MGKKNTQAGKGGGKYEIKNIQRWRAWKKRKMFMKLALFYDIKGGPKRKGVMDRNIKGRGE